MPNSLVNPDDSLERQNEKLRIIASALMGRVEQSTDAAGAAYMQFQRAAVLEEEVRARTRDLERALDLLNESNAQLAAANRETEAARSNLANAIETVQEGFALFSPDEHLIMCNSRFGMHMPDIRDRLVPGLAFQDYVSLVSQSRHLSLPDRETPRQWADRRLARHKDASVIFNVRMIQDRWVQVGEHRTPDGGTVILQTDVTDIMRLERQERERILDDQALLIRATLEHLKQGVCIFDRMGRLVGWNQRVGELLSIPVGRFNIGSSFHTIFDRFRNEFEFVGDTTAETIEDWASGMDRSGALSFEIEHLSKRTLAVFMQEMPDNGFVISFTDISAERAAIRAISEANETLERRVMERTLDLEDALAEAERANASKSRFVAAASHDLLQPLSAAKLYVASLEGDGLAKQPREIISKAANALQSVENILTALLDISKLDSGRANVHVSTVSVDLLLSQLRDELGPTARAKGLDLRVLRTGVDVLSDATYLRRILQNLLSNAIRYTDNGRVLVGARRLKSAVRIEVWDTGPGIPEPEQEQIFGEFQRLNATASAADGMGLGLAIVERACALLKHPLHLRSEVGRGTVFSVTVPLATRDSGNAPSRDTVRRGPQNRLLHKIVMLIENDDELRNALTLTMEQWGVDVLPCTDQEEAERLIDDIDVVPDAIIADHQLADGKLGVNAIAALAAIHGDIPACVISADRSAQLVQLCAGLGLPLIHKPIEPDALRGFLSTATG
ncbi:hybrid sensor histidine kinase/response regulator [Sedimentitalea arenosa]|uniref:histidine kinase n=1 Tax=Sedimentitalea arenosa TaxID=2798803 RepID=A0A8J7ISB6_9RHOB|nr:PAS-domain containing protein [Arenibacterium arenosum]MBJ6370437.1 PAS-domain containing protein [Arenibacterium arenosum]